MEDFGRALSGSPFPPMRSDVLDQAKALICGDRLADYGAPDVNFGRIAAIWSVILGIPVRADQVALCMTGLKIARLVQAPHADSYVDGAGYLALAAELALSPAKATP